MLSVALAAALHEAGLPWTPERGDRFVVRDRGMDEDVFVVSDMTIEVHDFPGGRVIGFNGTTEWALDSLEQEEALWLPRETQLRSLLQHWFRRLEVDPLGWAVVLEPSPGVLDRHVAADAEDAYAAALLAVLAP